MAAPVVLVSDYLNRMRWVMFERGMQVEWNRLNQLLSAVAGSGVVGGTTELDELSVVDGNGTGFETNAEATVTGPFAASGAQATVTGEKVMPADPGGSYGPTPARISQKLPTAGFRPSV
jgi:hypothetical protein